MRIVLNLHATLALAISVFMLAIEVRADVVESECGVIRGIDGISKVVRIPNLEILGAPKDKIEELLREEPFGSNIVAFICWRNSVIPSALDYAVVEAGKPLYFQRLDEHGSRTSVLEKSGGAYRLRLIDGAPFSDKERERIVALLEEFNHQSSAPD